MNYDKAVREAAAHLVELRRANPRVESWVLMEGDGPGPLFEAFREARERALVAYGLTPMTLSGHHTHGPLREQPAVDRDIALCALGLTLTKEAAHAGQ